VLVLTFRPAHHSMVIGTLEVGVFDARSEPKDASIPMLVFKRYTRTVRASSAAA
jgi:hypothetical protein